ncbi:MAG: YidC/Oxa1 family membrane protein insertase [Lachnospiraceae bacterium]|nr:YidC/Oxa1 family membrane protein insertase [Lachnospiraceae bacterium]
MLLTKSTAFIIGPIATLLGYIMNAIFWVQEQIGIPNIGLCIILFTIVIYMLMLPLTIQQQRFSKLQVKMNPELQEINKKYEKKKDDQAAMMKMNEETKAVYAKYGVHPMGSCLQLLIQMPILFALYRVIWNVPAYVTSVYNAFSPLASELLDISGAEEFMTEAASSLSVSNFEMTMNKMIDVLYKFKTANWSELLESFPSLKSIIESTHETVNGMNYFLGLNIADSPMSIMTSAYQAGSYLLIVGAVLVPVLAALTQWLNAKLASTGNENNNSSANSNDTMNATMKSMNTVMPLMSAVFCLSLPVGMGIYWIAGAVIRSIQQVFVNRSIDKIDVDELIKQNLEKENKKREKQGVPPQKIANTAKMSTRNIETSPSKQLTTDKKEVSKEERADKIKASTDYYKNHSTAKPGSLASKAQMVQQYNERTKKK